MGTQERKLEHIKIVLENDVEFKKSAGFEQIELIHCAFPEMDFSEVDTKTEFLDKPISAPVMIAGMTGGAKGTKKINRDLASVCQELKIPFGLGSQRAMMEDAHLKETYYVRDVAPDIPILGNIGISQLKGNIDKVARLLEAVEADGIAVHVNPAQEIVQKEGDKDFRKGYKAIAELASTGIPVIVKEVGCGISREVAAYLEELKIYGIDVGGAGGTSWVKVELLRGKSDLETFAEWGIPTALSVFWTRQVFSGKIIATGGIRNGLDIAKAIALGADLAGIALPILREYFRNGKNGVKQYLEKIIKELRVAMFLTGSKNLDDLVMAPYWVKGDLPIPSRL